MDTKLNHRTKQDAVKCTLLVGNKDTGQKAFVCNKTVLAQNSMVFQAMFFGLMAEPDGCEVKVPDVDPRDFEVAYRYLNTKKFQASTLQHALEILYVAKKYMFGELKSECLRVICKELKVSNVLYVYEFTRSYDEHDLTEHCLQFICIEADKILRDPSLLEIKTATFVDILRQDNLNICSELHLINAGIRWAAEQARRKKLPVGSEGTRTMLEPLLPFIRFSSLSAHTFTQGLGKSDILTLQEKYQILTSIVSSAETPPKFCANRRRRKYFSTAVMFCKHMFKSYIRVFPLENKEFLIRTSTICCPLVYVDTETSVLGFEVDQDILLLGFHLATCGGLPDSFYHDEIRAMLLVNEDTVIETTEEGFMKYNTLLPFMFKEPVLVRKDIGHEVFFTFSRNDYDVAQIYTWDLVTDTVDGVKFKVDRQICDGLIRSIIFAKV